MEDKLQARPTTRNSAVHSIREELTAVLIFVGIIWAIFLVDRFLELHESYGLVPRKLSGLVGIVTMTFLHNDFRHISSNTIPLVVLLSLLAGSKARSWKVVVSICLLGGSLLWLFGNPSQILHSVFGSQSSIGNHIGASLLIFGLITFLISSGFFEKRLLSIAIAVVVACMYGLTFLSGIIPGLQRNVSWEGHLCGGIAGVIVAYAMTRKPPSHHDPRIHAELSSN